MTKLTAIKIVHTAIWVFFNIVIFYLLYAVITNKIGVLVWVACWSKGLSYCYLKDSAR